ncbi:SPOR domain-containing protein [Paracraurococcus lichenis]|uniref:SPOR domain-containing protein n=1 Tax=Paracraurococcus lichenis TaxID=3064888 RepID=A0ABT9E8D0_9PROT|nr:SPOR domain-containing protein [Paracraurococcus sp. LOR1-02]MDO9712434.1 SPOR domain-containing protein [Paracraurococcus sp. LOR1-02]
MSDLAVPSWRPRQEKQAPSWRLLAVAGGLLGAVAVAGAVTWGLSRMGPRTVPVIEPDTRPLKVRPENPGGLIVPNQDQLVLEPPEKRRERELRRGQALLGTGPESPQLDLLRQQTAPPAPIEALPAPVPAAEPAPQPPAPLAAPQLPPPVAAAPATPAPVAAVAPRPVANGKALVQLGALVSEEAARAEWERLSKRVPELAGFQPKVTKLEREGQAPLYRLRTGGLADPAAAKALCEAVKAKGGACNPVGG